MDREFPVGIYLEIERRGTKISVYDDRRRTNLLMVQVSAKDSEKLLNFGVSLECVEWSQELFGVKFVEN